MPAPRRLITLITFMLITLALIAPPSRSTQAFTALNRPGFPLTLPNTQYVRFGMPTLADINGDDKLEILVGTLDGKLIAVNYLGQELWRFDVSAAINNAVAATRPGLRPSNNPIQIRSAPAVGDINNDGQLEIVVAAGDISSMLTHGGVMAVTSTGQPVPGWPFVPRDVAPGIPGFFDVKSGIFPDGAADGLADGVVSSPAIGDINGDGRNEVVFGSFDHFVYALNGDASHAPGWPQFVYDTVWSSPALADLNGDGKLNVIIGIDAHVFNDNEGYTSEDGGELQVFNGDGTRLWRVAQDEVLISSPAVADLDGDGKLEIAAGSGNFYCCNDGTPSEEGKYFSVWNHDGSLLWRTPLPTQIVGSPALGDVNDDGRLEIVVGGMNGVVYTFEGATGRIIWATTVLDNFSNQFNPNPVVYSPVLGDYTGNGVDDVFVALGWNVIVVRGSDGVQLTATTPSEQEPAPAYYTEYSINGAPAVGDLDGNGKLELVAASAFTNNRTPPFTPVAAQIHVWELPNSTAQASWPQFGRTPDNRGVLIPRTLNVSAQTVGGIMPADTTREFRVAVAASDASPISWTVEKNDPSNLIELTRTQNTADGLLVFTVDTNRAPGRYSATLTVKSTGFADQTITVNAVVADNAQDVFLPVLWRR